MKILIKNGHVIDPANGRDEELDILINDGVIAEVGKSIATDDFELEVIDASGLVVTPGLICTCIFASRALNTRRI